MREKLEYNISLFMDSPLNEKYIENTIKKINYDKEIGFAGFKNKEGLKQFLNFSVFGKDSNSEHIIPDLNEISKIIGKTLELCSKFISTKINIFVFSTVDKFTISKLGGVSGYSPWKNTILLNISEGENLEKAIKETLVHELAHAISLNNIKVEKLKESLIFEGIAENFKEEIVKEENVISIKPLSEKRSFEILKDLNGKLDNYDSDLYRELFFGTGKYPLWTGYSIGYYLVKKYLENLEVVNWSDIFKTDLSEIFDKVII